MPDVVSWNRPRSKGAGRVVSSKPGPARLKRRISDSPEETFVFARNLARTFKGNEVVFLIGELGAGKTVFAKGIAAGLGLKNTHQVCSPTFTLMNVYFARVPIYHFDLYRLGRADEITDLGFEDYIGQGVVVVEWAEKIDFPLRAISITIAVGAEERRIISITEQIKEKRGQDEH